MFTLHDRFHPVNGSPRDAVDGWVRFYTPRRLWYLERTSRGAVPKHISWTRSRIGLVLILQSGRSQSSSFER